MSEIELPVIYFIKSPQTGGRNIQSEDLNTYLAHTKTTLTYGMNGPAESCAESDR